MMTITGKSNKRLQNDRGHPGMRSTSGTMWPRRLSRGVMCTREVDGLMAATVGAIREPRDGRLRV